MSQTVFGRDYAGAYDELYRDKDYAGECDLIERIFHDHALSPVQNVLDLGCGTGGHSALLAQRGYAVMGVDRSEDMLARARARGGAQYTRADIARLQLDERFDAVVCMFAVFGYLTRNPDLRSALASTRRHLNPGGLLFADVWYGPAVLAQRPSERIKVVDSPDGGQLLRVSASRLDVRNNVCTVSYELWRIERDRVLAHTREQHAMRYFFEPELELLLSDTGFELVHVGGFPNLDEPPSEQTWNVAFVARAC